MNDEWQEGDQWRRTGTEFHGGGWQEILLSTVMSKRTNKLRDLLISFANDPKILAQARRPITSGETALLNIK